MKSSVVSGTLPSESPTDDPVATLAAHQAALSEAESELESLTTEIRAAGLSAPEELVQRRVAAHYRVQDLRATLPGVEQAALRWRQQQVRSAAQEQWAILAAKRRSLYANLEEAIERVNSVFAEMRKLQAEQLVVVNQAAEIAPPAWLVYQGDRLGGMTRTLAQQTLEALRLTLGDILPGILVQSAQRLPRLGVADDAGCKEKLTV